MINSVDNSKDNLFRMVRVLSKMKRGVNVVHINAQSLKNKIDEFRYIFESSDVDVIAVSETWFLPELANGLFSLNGYRLFRSDRIGHGGGVALYIRNSFQCKIISNSQLHESIEYIFVEISCDNRKILCGVVYRPSKKISFDNFFQCIERLSLLYSDIIISGDFNNNVFVEHQLSSKMLSYGMYLVNSNIPTHYTSTTETLIDLFFVSSKENILLYDQLSASVFSKHDLCFLTYGIELSQTDKIINYKDFKNIDFSVLAYEYSRIDWDIIYHTLSIDQQVLFLENFIKYLYDKCVPLKTIKQIPYQNAWFDNEIKILIGERDVAYTRWKRFKIPELHQLYKKARNIVNIRIKIKKKNYYAQKFQRAINSRNTWKNLRSMGIAKDNVSINEHMDIDEVNRQFVNIPMQTSDANYYTDNSCVVNHNSCFDFSRIRQTDVLWAINSIKSNAVGTDGIDPRFLKILLPNILPYITHIFNSILLKSYFPSAWKYARIMPIPKTDGTFRPIAILPYLSKVFEKIINNEIVTFINSNSLMNCLQSGFRANHSCTTALLKVSEDIRSDLDSNMVSFLVLLDHSKAFDTVDHSILCLKLQNFFHFSAKSVALIKSYLSERSQSVSIGHRQSMPLFTHRGVPQGSIMGPLLYSIYCNDLTKVVNFSNTHMYADDLQIYISSPPDKIRECAVKLNKDLENINIWAKANGLALNPKKSKCMLIRNNTFSLPDYINIVLSGSNIDIVNKANNLGVTFNNRLMWDDHVSAAIGKTYGVLRNVYITQQFTPKNIRVLLAKTYLIPKLLYSCELFCNCSSEAKSRLRVAFNSIIRYVFGLKRRDHVSNFAKEILGVSFENYLKIRTLICLHNIIYIKEPQYLFSILRFSRSSRGNHIIQLRHNKRISDQHFFINAIRLWNYLPNNIQTIRNKGPFKTSLFSFFNNLENNN